jgi:DNA-binding LacI/PurR family transcriptional regulator
MKDVAKLAMVSPAIVSRVINNDPTLPIKDETRERVLKAIDKLQYKPDILGRSLRSKRTHSIAVVVSDIINPYYAGIIKGAQEAAAENGFSVMFFNTEESQEREQEYIEVIQERYIDGVILTSVLLTDTSFVRAADCYCRRQ